MGPLAELGRDPPYGAVKGRRNLSHFGFARGKYLLSGRVESARSAMTIALYKLGAGINH